MHTDPDDYTAVVGSSLLFQSGAVVGSTVCENITIIDNSPLEDLLETFSISLSTTDPGVSLVDPSGTVTIVDNDCEGILLLLTVIGHKLFGNTFTLMLLLTGLEHLVQQIMGFEVVWKSSLWYYTNNYIPLQPKCQLVAYASP